MICSIFLVIMKAIGTFLKFRLPSQCTGILSLPISEVVCLIEMTQTGSLTQPRGQRPGLWTYTDLGLNPWIGP